MQVPDRLADALVPLSSLADELMLRRLIHDVVREIGDAPDALSELTGRELRSLVRRLDVLVSALECINESWPGRLGGRRLGAEPSPLAPARG